jgi:hypothetical protein
MVKTKHPKEGQVFFEASHYVHLFSIPMSGKSCKLVWAVG